jgi:hypothetical protein
MCVGYADRVRTTRTSGPPGMIVYSNNMNCTVIAVYLADNYCSALAIRYLGGSFLSEEQRASHQCVYMTHTGGGPNTKIEQDALQSAKKACVRSICTLRVYIMHTAPPGVILIEKCCKAS